MIKSMNERKETLPGMEKPFNDSGSYFQSAIKVSCSIIL